MEENKTIKIFKDGRFVKQIEPPNGDYKKIPLNQYIDLITEWKKSKEFYEEYGDDTNDRSVNIQKMMKVVEQVSAYYDCPELLDCELEMNGVREKANFKNLSSIYTGLWSMPKQKLLPNFSFDFKGKKYTFKTVKKDRTRYINIFQNLNVNEAINSLEVLRWRGLNAEKDVTGSYLYSSYLSLTAILTRSEGEELPLDRQQCIEYLEEKIHFMKGIPAYIPLYVEFWFDSYYKSLQKKSHLQLFFNPVTPPSPRTSEGREQLQKEIKRNKEIMKQIGYRNIIYRLLELGAFNNSKQTPLEAALSADFETAIELISEDNRL